jgi:hypothetical protein
MTCLSCAVFERLGEETEIAFGRQPISCFIAAGSNNINIMISTNE